jgi:hypothetical protein
MFLVPLAVSLSALADDGLVVGVLDMPQCTKETKASARLLFAKEDSRWVALNNEYEFPKGLNLTQFNWTIAFDGRNLGNLELRDPSPSHPMLKDWYYGRDKLYEPVNREKVPSVKNQAKMFAGWCQAPADRPLVLVSRPNFSDPEGWKSFSPDQAYKRRLYMALRLRIGRFDAIHCVGSEERPEPWDFTPEDLVLYKSYRSASGRELVSIGIDPEKIGCDLLGEPQWSNNWFLIENGKVDFLGTQMELVDAGDYDKDGHSELLFWFSGYNRDGYVLAYDQLRRKAEYIWSYH